MGGHSTGSGAAPRPYDAVVQALIDGFVDLMFRGGFVMWPLLALSVLMVALTIERSVFWVNLHGRRGRARFARLVDALRRGQRARVEAIRAERPDVYSDLAEALVRLGPTDPNAVAASEEVRPRIDRFLGTLATIVTAAPLLGILGTVSGIIKSFALLGGRGMPDPAQVSHGIAEALIATASGLSLALVTLFPYMIFRAQADRAVGRMETIVASAQSASWKSSTSGTEGADVQAGAPAMASSRR